MGRYYNTNNFEGKFGFALQGSDDPEIFGMEEMEPSSISYYLEDDEENRKEITETLDKQYDILGIPKEERVYIVPARDYDQRREIFDKLQVAIDTRMWRKHDPEKDGIGTCISDESAKALGWEKDEHGNYPTAFEKDPDMPLAACRVFLGIKILSDLEADGYCELEAEL